MLWDIDGTLVDVHGSGRRAFALALERTWGVKDDLAGVRFAGATDLGVLSALRGRGGLALDPAHDGRFFEVMCATLAELLAAAPADARPGAVAAVDALHARGAVQGLVTGNGRRCAYEKLRSAGLDGARFGFGGFGDEHADREELAVRALARAPGGGAGAHVFLVGDTPSDIRAARRIGAVAVAVAGFAYDRSALAAAGADHVLDDLSGLTDVVR